MSIALPRLLRALALTALLGATLFLGGCISGDGDGDGSPTATPEATPTAEVTASPTGVATATVEPVAQTRPISGLFNEPRETTPDIVRMLTPRPPSPFELPDRGDVVLYDTREGTEENLGPGVSKAFSPDGTRLAWTAGLPTEAGEIWVLDLQTGERKALGAGWVTLWTDDETLYVQDYRTNEREFVDAGTGDRAAAPGQEVVFPPLGSPVEAGGYQLRYEALGDYPRWSSTYLVEDLSGARLPLRFDVYRAVLAPDGALFVATTPEEPSGPDPNAGPHIETGLSNLFEVDLDTGEATFIATALVTAPGWPFSASESIVVWTEDACSAVDEPTHRMLIRDRRSGSLTAIAPGAWISDAVDTRIGLDQLGISAWLDTDTLE